jgi:hypothetical protein
MRLLNLTTIIKALTRQSIIILFKSVSYEFECPQSNRNVQPWKNTRYRFDEILLAFLAFFLKMTSAEEREATAGIINTTCKQLVAYVIMFSRSTYTILLRLYIRVYAHRRSQWQRGLKHKPSSLVRKLGSWVRIPLEACMSVFIRFSAFLCAGSYHAKGWSPVQGVIPTV